MSTGDPQDIGVSEDTGPTPDTTWGPQDDVPGGTRNGEDGGDPSVDGSGATGVPSTEDPATVSGQQSGSDSGGCGAGETRPSSSILAWLIVGLLALRRRERHLDFES